MPEFEGRFAEVTRKARAARARMEVAQQAKAAAIEQHAALIRDQPEPAYSEWDSAPTDDETKLSETTKVEND